MLTDAFPSFSTWWLPYAERLQSRPLHAVTQVVIHCTELPDLATAREYGERVLYDSGTGNSGHFYIDRDGHIHAFVPLDRVAHHVRGHNLHTIGIELINLGRWPHWLDSRHQTMQEPYPEIQIQALVYLLNQLAQQISSLQTIAGHEDLDRETVPATDDASKQVARKRDPGSHFPWEYVLKNQPLQRPVDPLERIIPASPV